MKHLIAILLALTLSVGCSTTDVLKAAGGALGVTSEEPMVGIDTDIGDKQLNTGTSTNVEFDDVEGSVQLTNNNQKLSKNVSQAEQVTFYERMSPFTLVILILGWLLPSPSEGWRLWKNRNK